MALAQSINDMKPEDLPPQLRPPHPAAKFTERYFNIDPKRKSSDMYSEDALPRSREFKRIDSTYYVGWMFEGMYKFEHAADFIGYKNAIAPLERALDLLEHDYRKILSVHTTDVMAYIPIYKIQMDYTILGNTLMNCYSNTEQPDKAFGVLRRELNFDLQFDYYLDIYNYMAWTVHRSRFYTHNKYAFLRNSIDENEALANKYLDSALMRMERFKDMNNKLRPGMGDGDKTGVYHYKNILYSYSFQIDSAQHYFDLMDNVGRLPNNNYGNFKLVCGDFRTAEENYKIAARRDGSDKRLLEWAYYSTTLDVYKSKPKEGIDLAKAMIAANGPTPGYGWYNLALARALMYDGQINESKKYAQRAGDFKEVHIGTTLGQSHYDFTTQLLKLINKEREYDMLKFEHANWWYNPSVLLDMASSTSEKYMQQYILINQFALNPERDRVIYKLFSTESTVGWDEIWYLVHDFSTNFFIDRFQKELKNDKRVFIRKYFQLFLAKFKIKQGHYKEAKADLDALAGTTDIDLEYEKLFTARLLEAQAICAKELGKKTEMNEYLYKLYVAYPQLVPFCGIPMNMELIVEGEPVKEVVSRLKDCNINWVTNSSIPAPKAYISFSGKGDSKTISYYVMSKMGNYLVPRQSFTWQKADEAGTALAYKLFNIGAKPLVKEGKDGKENDKTAGSSPFNPE